MTTNRPLKVFLCHSSNDKPAVRELYQKLRAESWIQPWLDEEELYPGQDWNLEIEKAVEAADAIIVCLSKGSITKEGYVQRELRIVLDYADYKPEGTLYLMPVRLEECEPPRRLRPWQYADYFEGQRERGFQRLLVSLKRRSESLGLKIEEPAPKQVEETVAITDFVQNFNHVRTMRIEDIREEGKAVPKNKIILSNGMELMQVEAGEFLMGSNENNPLAYKEEFPQHIVDIPYDYWMARYPTTNELYSAYANAKGSNHLVDKWEAKSNHPVVWASWDLVLDYCQWLTNSIKEEIPHGLTLRLPTEAEWEKAARWNPSSPKAEGKGRSLEYTWGDAFDKTKCNSSDGGKGGTTPVDLYSPQGDSFYGCADMIGNVWNWTHSEWKSYPYHMNDGRENESPNIVRVVRGGSFDNVVKLTRCASRLKFASGYGWSNLGFRVCLAPPLPQ